MVKYHNGEMYVIPQELIDEIRADAIDEFKNFIRNNKHYFVGDMAEMLIYEFEQMQLKEQK